MLKSAIDQVPPVNMVGVCMKSKKKLMLAMVSAGVKIVCKSSEYFTPCSSKAEDARVL